MLRPRANSASGRKQQQQQQQQGPGSFPSPPASPGQLRQQQQQQQQQQFNPQLQQQQQQQQQPQQMMGDPNGFPAGQGMSSQSELVISIQDFFFHFVVPQYGPPPADFTVADVKNACISFISSARLSPRDVRITEDMYGGTVWLSNRGLRVLENFVEMKRVSSAAITIQRIYRGFIARKRFAMMKEGEVNIGEVEEVAETGGAPIAPVNSRGSIIVDEVDLKRLSVGSSYIGSKRSSFVVPHQMQQAMTSGYLPHQVEVSDGAFVPIEDGGYHVLRTHQANQQPQQRPQLQQQSQPQPEEPAAPRPSDPEKDRDRAERRRSKIMAFKRHLTTISQSYQEIVQGADPASGASAATPSDREIQFMKLLNSDDTFRLSTNLRALHKVERPVTIEEAQKYYEEQGGIPGGRTPAQMYLEYSSRVVEWMTQVIPYIAINPQVDLVQLLRSGDLLCELAVAIYPRVQCQLLQKGPEFTIHKIIFFLELCKTIGIKPSMLFSVQDLLLGGAEHDPVRKSALTVLRTVCALERQARRRGWNGPAMVLKPEGSEAKRRSSRGSTHAPLLDGAFSPDGPSQDPRNSRRLSQNRRSRTPTRNSSTSPGRSVTSKTSSSSMTGSTGKRQSRRISTGTSQIYATASGSSTPLTGTASSSAEDLSSVSSHPDRLKRISAMTANTARESLYNYYAASTPSAVNTEVDLDALARREYEELLAAVKEKERVEAEEAERIRVEKQMEEEEQKKKLALENETIKAFSEGMRRRNRGVEEILASEETFVHNMTAISDFLSQLLYRRRRESKRHSRGLPPLDDDLETPDPTNPYLPKEGETPSRAALRVENENEDLALLDRVVADIVILHSDLISDLRACLAAVDEENAGCAVGEVMMRFAMDVGAPYISYAVVTQQAGDEETSMPASKTGGLPLDIFGRSHDSNEFSLKVVQRFMGETYPSSQEFTPDEWRWYLETPLKRLGEFEGMFKALAEQWKKPQARASVLNAVVDVETALAKGRVLGSRVEKGLRRVERDDRRLGVASVKMGCVSRAIGKHVGVKS